MAFIDGPNLYMFASNRPCVFSDPSGMACCDVTSFTPKSATRLTVIFEQAGDVFKLIVGMPMELQATFRNAPKATPPAACACCEFRQYVRGTLQGRLRFIRNGKYVPGPKEKWVETKTAEFTEDATSDGRHYGHRSDENSPNDMYTRLRDDGCNYSMKDYPGIDVRQFILDIVNDKLIVEVNFKTEFLQNIIDVCNKNRVVKSHFVSASDCAFFITRPPDDELKRLTKRDPEWKMLAPSSCGW